MKLQSRNKTRDAKQNPAAAIFTAVFMMFIISGLLLLLLALLLFQLELSEEIVRIGVIVIYVISGFAGGFLMGKIRKEQKFLWGLAAGVSYFLLLLLVSLLVKDGAQMEISRMVTAGILCSASGMAGGMVS